MMTRFQFLLTKLAEECNEVAQIALKTQQFGFESGEPGQSFTNRERICQELTDIAGIVQMLNEEFGLDATSDYTDVMNKINKVNKYYQYSVDLGLVEDMNVK